MVTRRTLLKYGGIGAGLLAVAGVGISLLPTQVVEPKRPLVVLDATTYSVVVALADRLCPGGDGLPRASDLDVGAKLDALLYRLDPASAAEVVQLLRLVENGLVGLLLDGRISTFTAASPEVQDRTLRAWQRSGIRVRRIGFKALHGLISGCYWSDPVVYPFVGYPGPPDLGQR